jgi:hypothetical protein
MTMGHYLRSMEKLASRFTRFSYKDPKRQRLYLKDIDTPDVWAEHLKAVIPESVYYLNDCIEARTGGDGAIREPNEYGQMRFGKGVAPAADLMSSLPPEMRAQNMMCYIGHEGTYTPAHREMCASLGHNIMVEASEDGKGEKAGSSIWFMTETKEREVVSEYFLSMLGHDIEVEKHFAQVNAWKKAPFNVWVVEQRVGDLILIPPLAPHQVWNRGTRTMKAAWNRTTVDTLELALHEALPRARMVCRDEQYKNKAIIYYTLVKYHGLLQRDTIEPKMWKYGRIKQLLENFKRLFALYTEVLVSEMFSPKLPTEKDVEFLPFDSNVTCSYCRCNIFNRFLTCKSCILTSPSGEEDTYDICMDCYAMGRSCACISNLNWVEQWDWSTLMQNYEQWRNVVVQFDGFFDIMRSPQPLDVARKRYGRKPVAEVCQEQLKIRPWNDINNPTVREPSPGMSDVEPEVDDDGRPTRKRGKKFSKAGRGRVEPVKDKTHACHICCHHDWNWKLAFCTTCNLAYCYGVLWRAFDLMPQSVMEDKDWQCPRCLKICSCGKCRKNPSQTPYAPKGTLLGHDTRKVADYRSVESLVDFSKTNLGWLRGENDHNPQESARMKRLKEKAEAEKARVETVDERYIDGGDDQTAFMGAEEHDQAGGMHDIDPVLRDFGESSTANAQSNGHYRSPYETSDSTANGDHHAPINGEGQDPFGWTDGNYDLDDPDSFHPPGTNYPSGLFGAPVAPMLAPEESYPDPTHSGPNRMMGIGYYQQGSGIDRILYDTPTENGSTEETLHQTPSQNPNFALSDLLDLQLQTETSKKRKKDGEEDEEDEFFTSKRQRKLAQSKKGEAHDDDDVAYKPKPAPRQPRRTAVKEKKYVDLGEDSVPIRDDEVLPAYRKHADGDPMEFSAQAMRRLGNSAGNEVKSKQAAPRKRRSIRAQDSSKTASPASNTIKTPRKSAWLARKEAQESGTEIPGDLPKRTRVRRSLQENETGLDGTEDPIPPGTDDWSGSEYGGNGEVRDEETDSIFGQPIERNGVEEAITWRAPEDDPNVHLAEIVKEQSKRDEQEKSKRPRGRPRKKPADIPVDLRSPSPMEETRPSPIEEARSAPMKLLSLKEKLALKGKSFKIVAAKQQPAAGGSSSGPPSARSTPSALKPILKNPAGDSPNGWSNANAKPQTLRFSPEGPSASPSFILPSYKSTPPAAVAPAPPVKKGPTVVRLVSPDDSEVESETEHSTVSSDDGSDSSIPAVVAPPKPTPGGGSL